MYVYDIECLSNYFLVCFLKVEDGSRIKFEISDYHNDSKRLYSFKLKSFRFLEGESKSLDEEEVNIEDNDGTS